MAVAMNKELLALREAGCRCIQIEEPSLHFWANTYGQAHDEVKFMLEAYNREVQGLDDVELWIHTCWGNPNMQRVRENDSYRESFQIYLRGLPRRRLDHRNERPQLPRDGIVCPLQREPEEKDCRRCRQPSQLPGRAARGRGRLDSPRPGKYIAPEQLIVSSDCGFGRQGCNREIAF